MVACTQTLVTKEERTKEANSQSNRICQHFTLSFQR